MFNHWVIHLKRIEYCTSTVIKKYFFKKNPVTWLSCHPVSHLTHISYSEQTARSKSTGQLAWLRGTWNSALFAYSVTNRALASSTCHKELTQHRVCSLGCCPQVSEGANIASGSKLDGWLAGPSGNPRSSVSLAWKSSIPHGEAITPVFRMNFKEDDGRRR